MSRKRNDRYSKPRKRQEAIDRNAAANAKTRECGHVHGDGVGCFGREATA